MPISSAGRATRQTGVTLIEMMVVVLLIAVMVGLSFPAVTSGMETIRLNSATQDVATMLNSALNRAERRQQPMELTVVRAENALYLRSTDPGFQERLELPQGVTIARVIPELQVDENLPRTFMLYPGGTVPHIGVVLINRRHSERMVQVDPMTGVPRVSIPQ